ncbi:hypothetical protein PG994_002490 [Apiospora phragmitis]|uniref:Uncharacterized protein n=1 Tax=Apiospora phragmitis TaxID=2905665 RepID=A0ABR1WWH7_9PEZI
MPLVQPSQSCRSSAPPPYEELSSPPPPATSGEFYHDFLPELPTIHFRIHPDPPGPGMNSHGWGLVHESRQRPLDDERWVLLPGENIRHEDSYIDFTDLEVWYMDDDWANKDMYIYTRHFFLRDPQEPPRWAVHLECLARNMIPELAQVRLRDITHRNVVRCQAYGGRREARLRRRTGQEQRRLHLGHQRHLRRHTAGRPMAVAEETRRERGEFARCFYKARPTRLGTLVVTVTPPRRPDTLIVAAIGDEWRFGSSTASILRSDIGPKPDGMRLGSGFTIRVYLCTIGTGRSRFVQKWSRAVAHS